jgi:hypothetical protein
MYGTRIFFFPGFVCKRDFTEKVERLFDYENFNSKIMVSLQVGIIPFLLLFAFEIGLRR